MKNTGGKRNRVDSDWERRKAQLRRGPLPRHVAIIMDGNGRWARQRGLPRLAGHRAGLESIRQVVTACGELGIGVLTLYAFSTENWKRPAEEVRGLMDLLVEYVDRELDSLVKNGVRVRVIGHPEELPPRAQEALERVRQRTAGGQRLELVVALNYGGRREITDACRRFVADVVAGNADPRVDEETFASYLDTAGLPDPDLLIRPSGELRISNFLLWQSAYTEFWFTPVLWPDFRPVHLAEALADYQRRRRRFGGLDAPGGG
ncbi:MAG: isoprenyl transferase [Firmicutes bacterium]|nr:isoprenyl transferase [Bacillota bacterium]